MNKETRTFIWGLIILYVCASALGDCIFKIMYVSFDPVIDSIILILMSIGCWNGSKRITKTTN